MNSSLRDRSPASTGYHRQSLRRSRRDSCLQFEARHRREGKVSVGTSKIGLHWFSQISRAIARTPPPCSRRTAISSRSSNER